MRYGALLLVAAGLSLPACTETTDPGLEPAVPPLACGRPEVMYATVGPEGGRFGGLDGALEPGTQAMLRSGDGEVAALEADAEGRFEVRHAAEVGQTLTLEACGASVDFVVRDPDVARAAAVRSSLGGVGAVPNDLIMVGGPEGHAVVVRSGDNAVSTVGWRDGIEEGPRGVRLPEVDGAEGPVFANPWLATSLTEVGDRVAVTAWAQGRVYIVNLTSGAVEQTLAGPGPITLDAPFILTEPFDVDGDGAEETEVSRFTPSHPQPVAVVQGRLLVAYASILRVDRGAAGGQVALPAVVASYDLHDLSAAPVIRALHVLNPQELRADGRGGALLTCSGLFRIDGLTPVTPGAVLRLDPTTLATLGEIPLPEFLPTTSIEAAGRVWVGSLAAARVLAFEWSWTQERARVDVEGEGVDSIFRLFELPGGLLGVPSFNTDRLHVLDPRTGALNPAPFFAPLQIGPGGTIFSGLQIVARRPGRAGVDFVGPDLMALSGLSASVTPVELRKVLGP